MIITLGSSFSYRINPGTANEVPVANCHRAPAQLFSKHLMSIDETTHFLTNAIEQLLQFNPALNFIFTVSPVRHLRDGVVENNRSKARLIETVHQLTRQFERLITSRLTNWWLMCFGITGFMILILFILTIWLPNM